MRPVGTEPMRYPMAAIAGKAHHMLALPSRAEDQTQGAPLEPIGLPQGPLQVAAVREVDQRRVVDEEDEGGRRRLRLRGVQELQEPASRYRGGLGRREPLHLGVQSRRRDSTTALLAGTEGLFQQRL